MTKFQAIYLLIFLCLHFGNVTATFAQSKGDTSDQSLLSSDISDEKIKARIESAEIALENNIELARKEIAIAEQLLTKEADPFLWLRFYVIKSTYHRIQGEIDEGRSAVKMGLLHANNHKDSLQFKAKFYTTLGALADDDSQVELAIAHHLKALRYAEAIDYKAQIATICNGIGRAYLYLSEYDTAKKYYLRAIGIYEEQNTIDNHLAASYTNLSTIYDTEGDYENSLLYLDKSIVLKKEHRDYINLIPSYNNKAYTLLLMKRLGDATTVIKQAIQLADSMKVETEQMYCYSTYAEILYAQNRSEEAEKYMSRSIEMSKKNNDLYLAKYNLDLMYSIYNKRGDYKKALEFYKQRSAVMDSVYRVKSRKEVEKLALEYETEKKNQEINLLNTKQEQSVGELRKSRLLQWAFLLTALLLVVIVLLLRSRYKNKVKTELLIQEALERSYQKKLSDTELQALRAQMNPHFLFNCLNSINSFIIKNEQEKASEYLSKFSMLIRKVLSNSKSPKVTLANELEALQLYVELEALRFNKAFEYELKIDDKVELDYLEIPPLIIQPYVENSIWHGLLHKKDGLGRLMIAVDQDDLTLTCTIRDNGIGRKASKELKSKDAISHKSFGMNITKERLEHINGTNNQSSSVDIIDLVTPEGKAIGTEVIIKIAI